METGFHLPFTPVMIGLIGSDGLDGSAGNETTLSSIASFFILYSSAL